MRAILILVGVSVVGGACNGASKPAADEGAPRREASEPVRVQPLDSSLQNYYRFSSGYEDSARLVITSESQWSAVWTQLVRNHGPKPETPRIDFSKEQLIMAAMGTRSSGGYSIGIRSVVEEGDELVATVVSTSPGRTCGTTQALTAPVDVVRVNRPGSKVRFVEEVAVHDCGD